MSNTSTAIAIPETTAALLKLLQGTGVNRIIITDRSIEYFPRMTPEAIDRLTDPAAGPLYTDVMRHHYPATRQPNKFQPGDYDISGSSIKIKHAAT